MYTYKSNKSIHAEQNMVEQIRSFKKHNSFNQYSTNNFNRTLNSCKEERKT